MADTSEDENQLSELLASVVYAAHDIRIIKMIKGMWEDCRRAIMDNHKLIIRLSKPGPVHHKNSVRLRPAQGTAFLIVKEGLAPVSAHTQPVAYK